MVVGEDSRQIIIQETCTGMHWNEKDSEQRSERRKVIVKVETMQGGLNNLYPLISPFAHSLTQFTRSARFHLNTSKLSHNL
jgi:hypothetical protein